MLVLSRRENEKVIIQVGDKIIVVGIAEGSLKRTSVGLTFEADGDVQIDREEIYDSKQKHGRNVAHGSKASNVSRQSPKQQGRGSVGGGGGLRR